MTFSRNALFLEQNTNSQFLNFGPQIFFFFADHRHEPKPRYGARDVATSAPFSIRAFAPLRESFAPHPSIRAPTKT
jgi:hypothetical protein